MRLEHLWILQMGLRIYIYICVYTHTYIYIHIHIYTHTYIYKYIFICNFVYAYMNIYIHTFYVVSFSFGAIMSDTRWDLRLFQKMKSPRKKKEVSGVSPEDVQHSQSPRNRGTGRRD